MSELDALDAHLRNMKLELMNMLYDPFDQGRMATYIENALGMIARMQTPAPATLPPPTRTPTPRKEPQPIVLAPGKRTPKKG